MDFYFRDIASVLGREVDATEEELVITGFSTDTRTIEPGMMFIAIPGENFDGGNFISTAIEKGASAVLTEREFAGKGIITVGNSVKALGSIASAHRKSMDIPLIAVTGSTGKTSTRNYLTSVLKERFKTHFTKGNLNNHIGLPMTLLEIDPSHEVSVVEMGMSGPGEIDYLAGLTEPDFGVITNIGMSHIGMLGSQENIFKAKTEMVRHIKPGGCLVVNGDDGYLVSLGNSRNPKVITFGKKARNDFVIKDEKPDEKGCYSFRVDDSLYSLNVRGLHNIYNAMPAIIIGKMMGMSADEISNGLMNFRNEKLRLDITDENEITIINDAYNASPDSMKASLSILGDFEGRKIAVLGDMLEMGEFSGKAHHELGQTAAVTVDILMCCGKEAAAIADGAIEYGMSADNIHRFSDSDEAGMHLSRIIEKGDVILVKGSRGMKMENVIKYIRTGGY